MMTLTRQPWQKLLWGLAVVSVLSVGCFYADPVEAQSWWQRVTAPFRKNRGIGDARGRSRGAAVRDPDLCPYTDVPLTALVPNRNETLHTSKSHPTFWFYVPYQVIPNPGEFTLKFVLQDDTANDIYSAEFVLPEPTEAGILSLQLTDEQAALEVDKVYRWYFLIYCKDQQQVYEPAFVEGKIRRREIPEGVGSAVLPSFEAQLQTYAESNFWYEFFDALALGFWTNPNSAIAREGWTETLQTIELDGLVEEPIIGRYIVPATEE